MNTWAAAWDGGWQEAIGLRAGSLAHQDKMAVSLIKTIAIYAMKTQVCTFEGTKRHPFCYVRHTWAKAMQYNHTYEHQWNWCGRWHTQHLTTLSVSVKVSSTWSYSALGNCNGSLVVSMSKAQMRGSARCSKSGLCSRTTFPPYVHSNAVWLNL